MHHSDPMHYTMEQLVKALTNETMQEIVCDETEMDFEEENQKSRWDLIAKTFINEIDALFNNKDVYPYGYGADEVIIFLRPMLEPYAVTPGIRNLFDSLENTLSQSNIDPRPYMLLMKRAFKGNENIENYFRERNFK